RRLDPPPFPTRRSSDLRSVRRVPPYLRVAGTCAERSRFAARARSRRELRCAGVVADREAYPLAAAVWLVDTRDARADALGRGRRSEEHTSELQSPDHLV